MIFINCWKLPNTKNGISDDKDAVVIRWSATARGSIRNDVSSRGTQLVHSLKVMNVKLKISSVHVKHFEIVPMFKSSFGKLDCLVPVLVPVSPMITNYDHTLRHLERSVAVLLDFTATEVRYLGSNLKCRGPS